MGFNQRPVGIACFLMAIGKGKDGISRFPLGRWNDLGTQKSDVFDMVKTTSTQNMRNLTVVKPTISNHKPPVLEDLYHESRDFAGWFMDVYGNWLHLPVGPWAEVATAPRARASRPR